MRRPLPPLNALRAFECAARHRSFRKAALELHVTPAAISHQDKALEDLLGVQLFRRVTRGLELTAEAQASLPKLAEGFDALAGAVALLRAPPAVTTVRVGAAPSFAGKWLTPRLHGFVAAHPDADIRIIASTRFIDPRQRSADDFDRDDIQDADIDIAIRFGSGRYADRQANRLFDVRATPMCSPQLLEGPHPLLTPDDLRHHTLLHDDTLAQDEGGADWNTWLKAAGVAGVDTTRGTHFNHASLGLDAAIDGAGVVLSYPVLASSDLARGRLVAPFAISVPVDFGYFVVSANGARDQPVIAAFHQWLVEEARQDRHASTGAA